MQKAEDIAIREHKSVKIAVISGVGTRNYYRKLGYELNGPYMMKCLLEGYRSVLSYTDGTLIPNVTTPYQRKRITLDDDQWLAQFDAQNRF